MSDDPGFGVVDSNLQVHGLDNLYICDASVFPSTVTVNPMGSIFGVVESAAPRILAAA